MARQTAHKNTFNAPVSKTLGQQLKKTSRDKPAHIDVFAIAIESATKITKEFNPVVQTTR